MKLKPSRWMAGVCLLSGGLCMSAAAPTSAVSYSPNLSTPPAPPLPPDAPSALDRSTPELSAALQEPPATLSSLKVSGATLTQRDYRELSQVVTRKPLTAARAFVTRDFRNGVQIEAVGAPLFPIAGENATHQDQVRVPLIGINW